MDNNSNNFAIRNLSRLLLNKGVIGYKSLESTIIQVLSRELGEENELTKKARQIRHGYIVPSSFSHINGLTSDMQYNSEQYKMYVDLLNEVEVFLDLFGAVQSSEDYNPDEIYNLLISDDENAWESDTKIFERDRCISEYTDKDLVAKFSKLGKSEIDEIKKSVCIFAYEDNRKKDASLGFIKEITVRQTGVKIVFEKTEVLSFDDFHKLQFELDIKDWEYNRTHWAIKKVNLYKELNLEKTNIKSTKLSIPIDITKHSFDVSFTFAGESRVIVEQVVRELEQIIDKNKIFYDNNFLSQLARPSLDTLLQDIYRNRSKLIVVFLCQQYQDKKWCGLEFKAIRELIMDKEESKIMYIRLDQGNVDGVFNTDGYIDGTRFDAEQLACFIKERLDIII